MPIYPYTIALFSALIVATAWSGIYLGSKTRTKPGGTRLPPRQGDQFAARILNNQLSIVVIILFLWAVEHPQPTDFGYTGGEFSTALAFLLGIACYAAFAGAYMIVIRTLGMRDQMLVAAYLAHRIVWPRTTNKRRSLLAALILNPFTEELIYRGFVVYYLGNLFESVVLFSILGIVLCLAIHLYQGSRMLPFHAGFCLVSILILFSPLGIVGCFGLHLAGDLYPLTEIKHQLQAWRASRRRARLGTA